MKDLVLTLRGEVCDARLPTLPTRGKSPRWCALVVIASSLAAAACTKPSDLSRRKAREEVAYLVTATQGDLEEIRRGLPLGAKQLEPFFAQDKPGENAVTAEEALNTGG